MNTSACLVIGHRGACGYAPENSMQSFERAITYGVDMIECDVRLCASGELVIIHDACVDRICNASGYVRNLTLEQLKTLSCQGESIVTVQEMLGALHGRVKINFEVKEADIILQLADILLCYTKNSVWSVHDFLITSFIHQEIAILKETYPQYIAGPLMACSPIGYGACLQNLDYEVVVLDVETISKEFIDDIHNRGKYVFVYTVNEIHDIKRMINMRVDGIISNYPDRVIAIKKSGSS